MALCACKGPVHHTGQGIHRHASDEFADGILEDLFPDLDQGISKLSTELMDTMWGCTLRSWLL